MVIDTDGSAFITKAEFDSLKNNFQAQIDNYNSSIDSKIDGAIAGYLAGVAVSTTDQLAPIIPVGKKIISTTGNDYGWTEGNIKLDWTMVTGPYGDNNSEDRYCLIMHNKCVNKLTESSFREINVEYDGTRKTGLYTSHDRNIQVISATSFHWASGGYSTTNNENNKYFFFGGWRRINVEDDTYNIRNYAHSARHAVDSPITPGSSETVYSANRSLSLSSGEVYRGTNWGSVGVCTLSRLCESSTSYALVCPNSTPQVWGFYTKTRNQGFCNDSTTDSLANYNNNIGNHTILTNDSEFFKFETVHAMYKSHADMNWTENPTSKIEFGPGWGLVSTLPTWTDPTVSSVATWSRGLSWTNSHNSNIGYYHKPYIGCENIKNWNKVGIDYGSRVNDAITTTNVSGTLVNVNGSKYLSPVSGIPVFMATADGTVDLILKFEKDADHMPDTNSTYVDLYISNQPFKENDLGYNNTVIGPKSGTTARKLLSDQPAGHGAGSIKVDYNTDTNLKFEVHNNEPIFINFSAYEPSRSSYRGKCTATIQANILLNKQN